MGRRTAKTVMIAAALASLVDFARLARAGVPGTELRPVTLLEVPPFRLYYRAALDPSSSTAKMLVEFQLGAKKYQILAKNGLKSAAEADAWGTRVLVDRCSFDNTRIVFRLVIPGGDGVMTPFYAVEPKAARFGRYPKDQQACPAADAEPSSWNTTDPRPAH